MAAMERVSSVFGDDPGKGIPSGPAIPKDKPDDYPWDPSGGQGDPGFDILVLNDQLDWPEDARQNIQKAVQGKKGLVLIHHALGDNQNWPWWFEKVTGGLCVLDDRNGKKKSTITRPVSLKVELAHEHPILEGVKPFELADETAYRGMWQSLEITPLLQTTSSGYDQIVAWLGPGSDTRVVCIQPGSARSTYLNENFRKLVRNSILWCAGRM
jgi:type 1 glutamine amidotransferase